MAPPVFVGGTGRSGTTITAKLIGANERYHMIPVEVRFITDAHGLLDLAAGRVRYPRFLEHMNARWWRRSLRTGDERGIHDLVERQVLDAALDELRSTLDGDPMVAARRFAHALLDPAARQAGADGWVEMTPHNALRAHEILSLFPDALLVHSVRDGRDVAASVAARHWGPNDFDEALEWWAARLQEASRSMQPADLDRVLVITLEDLTIVAQDETVARILDFVGLEPDASTTAFVRRMVRPDKAHVNRWAAGMPIERRAAINERYRELLGELDAAGAGDLIRGLPPVDSEVAGPS